MLLLLRIYSYLLRCVTCYCLYLSYSIDYIIFVFFFFKQKTAYEMRISDWSSDVCSSDLVPLVHADDLDRHLVGDAHLRRCFRHPSKPPSTALRPCLLWAIACGRCATSFPDRSNSAPC